jgi:hypothetical protein
MTIAAVNRLTRSRDWTVILDHAANIVNGYETALARETADRTALARHRSTRRR